MKLITIKIEKNNTNTNVILYEGILKGKYNKNKINKRFY